MNKFTNWVKVLCKIGINGLILALVIMSIYLRFTNPQLTETQLFVYMVPEFLKFGCAMGFLGIVLWMINDIKNK